MDGETVYTATATFGRVYTYIGAAIAVLIALVLIIIGFVELFDKDTLVVDALITKATCATAPGGVGYQCVLDLALHPGGETQITTAATPGQFKAGQTVKVAVNPADPTKSAVMDPSGVTPRGMGAMMIGAGLLVGAGGLLSAYLARRYKAFAALEGLGGIGSLARAF